MGRGFTQVEVTILAAQSPWVRDETGAECSLSARPRGHHSDGSESLHRRRLDGTPCLCTIAEPTIQTHYPQLDILASAVCTIGDYG